MKLHLFIFIAFTFLLSKAWTEQYSGRQAAQNVAFSDFILKQVQNFRNNIKDSMKVGGFLHNAQPYINSSVEFADVSNLSKFTSTVSSNLDNLTLEISLEFPFAKAIGNYSLDGLAVLAESSIIVHGKGAFDIEGPNIGIGWSGKTSFQVNSEGYASLSNTFNHSLVKEPLNYLWTFTGIDGYEIIAENIKYYLDTVSSQIFPKIHEKAVSKLFNELGGFLNSVLKTIRLDEIIGNATLPTSTSTTTTSPGPVEPDVIIDVISDLDGSGWTVPTTDSCGYATEINGFFCNGNPVIVGEPFEGRGFWMSPCIGICSLEFKSQVSQEMPRLLRVSAFHNDITSELSRSIVKLVKNGNLIQEYQLFKSNGTYVELDFTQFSGSFDTVSITMENNGQGRFGILDSLKIFK